MKRKTLKQLDRQVSDWNKVNPIGSSVTVLLDNGHHQHGKTVSDAWVMGGHSAMVKLAGVSGAYLLDRVTRRTEA